MEGIAGGKFGASWCAWVPERNQLCMWAFAGLKKAGEELDNERIALCNLTWSDLNGKPIYYRFTPDTLPYKRGFALHADRAYAVAVERKVTAVTGSGMQRAAAIHNQWKYKPPYSCGSPNAFVWSGLGACNCQHDMSQACYDS